MNSNGDLADLGAFWRSTAKRTGLHYFTGQLRLGGRFLSVLLFVNPYEADGPNQPAFKLRATHDELEAFMNAPASEPGGADGDGHPF